MYNFKDVWGYFKARGWHSQNGGELSYDHFYIKPGKSVKRDEEGVDYFLGEQALVRYGYALRIFGNVEEAPLAAASPDEVEETLSQAVEPSSKQDKAEKRKKKKEEEKQHKHGAALVQSEKKKKHKQQRRSSGEHVHDPIEVISGSSSSDEPSEWSANDESREDDTMESDESSVNEEDEDEDDEEDSDDEDDDSDVLDDPCDDLDVPLRPPTNGKYSAKMAREAPRPRLKTSNHKRARDAMQRSSAPVLKPAQRSRSSSMKRKASSPSPASSFSDSHSRRHRKRKMEENSKRRVPFDDDSFSLGVDRYGASPPRRPPTISRNASATSTPINFSASSTPSRPPSVSSPSAGSLNQQHSFLSVSSLEDHNSAFEPDDPGVDVSDAQETDVATSPVSTATTTLVELEQVAFPPTSKDKYRVVVTADSATTCILLEHMETMARHECRFGDMTELPGNADNSCTIPGAAVLQALLRCLRGMPNVLIVNAGAMTDAKDDPGKLELLQDSKNRSEDVLTLRFAFPSYDFWQCYHNFPLVRVPTDTRIAQLLEQLAGARARADQAQSELESTRTVADTLKKQITVLTLRNNARQLEAARLEVLVKTRETEMAQLKTQADQLETQVGQLKAQAASKATKELSRLTRPADAVTDAQAAEEQMGDMMQCVVLRSQWMTAFQSRYTARSEDVVAMEWAVVVELADSYYSPVEDDAAQNYRAVRIRKSGTYQLNAHVTHDKDLRMAVRIRSTGDDQRLVGPTLVQLYDNKRRTSRVDQPLSLLADEQVSVVLVVDGSTSLTADGAAANECWPQVFKPRPNQLALTFLDPQLVYQRER